tara:strand:- start:259 stop:516 length:258 start_codon:yes stop_codon:yes gene_type:complete
MKSLIILLTLIIFSINNAYAKETIDCKNLKKFSLKAAMCKTKAAGSSIKNKWSKKKELKKEAKKNSGKKSIFKKFGEAKTLSDLK